MKILILGAGAIGGYYGARLIQAGANVTFLVRPRRAAAIASHGLRIDSALDNFSGQVTTVTQDSLDTGYDLIVLTCKTYDLPDAITAITPAVDANTVILPFLNGMRAYDLLDAAFGIDHVMGGIAYIATMLDKTGTIVHYGQNDTVIIGARTPAQTSQVAAIHTLLQASAGTRLVSDNITQALWDKWVMIAAGAMMTTLMRGTVADILATQEGKVTMQRAMQECLAVANASGFALAEKTIAHMESLLLDPSSVWAASMARDIGQQATRLEAGDIVGDMVKRAVHFGLDPVLTRAAYTHLQVYEAQQHRQSTPPHTGQT